MSTKLKVRPTNLPANFINPNMVGLGPLVVNPNLEIVSTASRLQVDGKLGTPLFFEHLGHNGKIILKI